MPSVTKHREREKEKKKLFITQQRSFLIHRNLIYYKWKKNKVRKKIDAEITALYEHNRLI